MALWLPDICNRLRPVKRQGSRQTTLARYGSFSDPSQRRLDNCTCGSSRIRLHRRRNKIASPHARSGAFQSSVALPYWRAYRRPVHICLGRTVASTTVGPGSLADGRNLSVHAGLTSQLLPESDAIQHRLVYRACHRPTVQQCRLDCLALRDNDALHEALQRGHWSTSRTRGAPDDRGRRRGVDRSRAPAAVDRDGHDGRCRPALS